MRSIAITLLGAAATIAWSPAAATQADEIVSLSDWRYDDLYGAGVSAEEFIEEMAVHSVAGEEIGRVEDILIGPDGRVVAVVAEIGGAWGLADTHVSVHFEEVDTTRFETGVLVPIVEEAVDEYEVYGPRVLDFAEVADRSSGAWTTRW